MAKKTVHSAKTGEISEIDMTPAEEAAIAASQAYHDGLVQAELAKQSRKAAFRNLNDNKPVTVGDLRAILEDAGII